MADGERTETLRDLVELRVPMGDAIEAVSRLPWDSEVDLVVFRAEDARRVLDAYLQGTMAPTDVERWADALEGREDVACESGADDRLAALIFELANPTLSRPLDRDLATQWIARLS